MILYIIIAAVIGFILGILVYRNNVDVISPIADKFDTKFDKLELKIEELKKQLEAKKTNID